MVINFPGLINAQLAVFILIDRVDIPAYRYLTSSFLTQTQTPSGQEGPLNHRQLPMKQPHS